MIDELTRENAVKNVKDGMSYLQAAKLHGVSHDVVRQWCHDGDIQSLQASKRKTDKEIIKTIMLHKAVSCHALAEILGYTDSGLSKNLQTMVRRGKIQSFRIPHLSHAAHSRRLLTKYINTRIYYVSKKDLAKWVRNQLPEEISSSLRKCVTQTFRGLNVKIFKEG